VKDTQLAQFVELQMINIAAQLLGARAAGKTNLLPKCDTTATEDCITVTEPEVGASLAMGNCGKVWNTTTYLYDWDGDCSARRQLEEVAATPRQLAVAATEIKAAFTFKAASITPNQLDAAAMTTALTNVKTKLTNGGASVYGIATSTLNKGSADFTSAAGNFTQVGLTTVMGNGGAGGGGASTSGASTMMLSAGALAGAAFLMF
jgi:hypothetical protein